MEQTSASDEASSAGTFAAKLHKFGVCSNGPSAREQPESVVTAHIMPRELKVADEIAADHGFERVDDEMDRRTYKPA